MSTDSRHNHWTIANKRKTENLHEKCGSYRKCLAKSFSHSSHNFLAPSPPPSFKASFTISLSNRLHSSATAWKKHLPRFSPLDNGALPAFRTMVDTIFPYFSLISIFWILKTWIMSVQAQSFCCKNFLLQWKWLIMFHLMKKKCVDLMLLFVCSLAWNSHTNGLSIVLSSI